jgi:hypothetical protein
MKVKDKVVNISDVLADPGGKNTAIRLVKSGTKGEIKKITPSKDGHLAMYYVKFHGCSPMAFYKYELVKLQA